MDEALRRAQRDGDDLRTARHLLRRGDRVAAFELLTARWADGDAEAARLSVEVLEALPVVERLAHAALLDRLAVDGVEGVEAAWSRFFPAAARLVGNAPGMLELRAFLYRVAAGSGNVLLCGESGTGVSTAGEVLHTLSGPRGILKVCHIAGCSEQVARHELRDLPRKGTLMLPYTSPSDLQTEWGLEAIARCKALETRVVVGGLDLHEWIERECVADFERFRIPPLRERLSDLLPIIHAVCQRRGHPAHAVDERGLARLRAHSWPGNVRELRNVVLRALHFVEGGASFERLLVTWLPETVA